jgi:hypothetical protein
LAIAFKVLHCLDMVEKSRSLSTEEFDLVEFLVAQDASLSSSLACEVVTIELSMPPPMACEPTPVEALTPDLQLTIAFEVLHHLDMVEKKKSLSTKEHDLV